MTIRKIENGYILTDPRNYEEYYKDAQSLFDGLLFKLEGKCTSFNGGSYGRVFVATCPTLCLSDLPRIEALETAVRYIVDNPDAAAGAGDLKHAKWQQAQRLARAALDLAD
jgi:hypothetical protein